MTHQSTDLWAAHPLGDQQHPAKAVIVPRFLRPANLVLQSQNHRIGIGIARWFHASVRPHFLIMRNHL